MQSLLCVEFVDARFYVTVFFYAGIYHTFGANLRTLHILCEGVELLAGIVSRAGSADTADVGGIVKYTEAVAFEYIHKFYKAHTEAQVGFVATIVLHSVGPGHTLEGLGEFHATDYLEEVLGHALEKLDDIVLFSRNSSRSRSE